MRKLSIKALVLLALLITSSIAVARMQCEYCGSTSIGYCDKSPTGRHEHISVSYRYADNSVDPDLVPRIHNVTNEEIEEQELRRLLIERLRQENQSHARGGMSHADDSDEQIQSQKAKKHFSVQAIVEKIKDMPWWGWLIVGSIGLEILRIFAGD